MSKLFDRRATLTIGTTELTGLDFTFEVKKTLKPEPNTADLNVWNLAPDTRKKVEQVPTGKGQALKGVPVRLEAGYKDATFQVYLGEVFTAQSETNGPDVITKLSTGDSANAARINVSIGAKTPSDVALRAIVKALGVGAGNLTSAVAILKAKGLTTLYPRGVVFSGQASQHMTDFCRSAGLEWSIQDGKVQIIDLGKPLDGLAIELSPQTGLVGSPSVDTKGIASATCLLIPDMRPGVKVSFNARSLQGGYRVIECDYKGDTYGNDWFVDIKAEKY